MSPGFRHTTTLILSLAMILVGVAIVVRTIVGGGGVLATGLIVGILFILAGAGRIWVLGGRER